MAVDLERQKYRNTAEYRRSAGGTYARRHPTSRADWNPYETARRGEGCNNKLTEADIVKIRENRKGHSFKQLAEIYGVHYNCIWKAYHRITWSHVR